MPRCEQRARPGEVDLAGARHRQRLLGVAGRRRGTVAPIGEEQEGGDTLARVLDVEGRRENHPEDEEREQPRRPPATRSRRRGPARTAAPDAWLSLRPGRLARTLETRE